MSFIHMSYLPWILLGFAIFMVLIFIFEYRYFKWVRRYWFLRRSFISYLSTLFYLAGVLCLLVSLLDLRGPETKIKSQIPDQKTVIMIDTSMSMLAEDVRPNRFQKALLLARHFVNKAIGHQIAVVVFSDTQKRVIPFTDDIDLLDSRIGALENLDLNNAGTSLRQSFLEAIQYLREESGDGENVNGNIVIFSDGEEHGANLKMNVPSGINVAFVGIGTLQGAAIPIRSSGPGDVKYFDSFKLYKGEKVTTKLDEASIERFGNGISHYKYWVASSYSMPTDEVISFFRDIFKSKTSTGDVRIRPVLYEYVVIPGVILISLGFLLSLPKTFVASLLFISLLGSSSLRAQEAPPADEAQKKLSPETERYLDRLKKGDLTKEEKSKLGELLLKDGKVPESIEVYKENQTEKDKNSEALFNYGTANLKAGHIKEGVNILSNLRKQLEADSKSKNKDLIQKIDSNLAFAFSAQNSQKKKQEQKQDQNKQQEQKNQDQQKQDQQKQGEKKDDKKQGQGKNNQQNQDKQNQDKKDQNKKDQKQGQNQQQQQQQSPSNQNNEQKKDDQKKDQGKDKKKDQNKDQDKDKEQKDQEEKKDQGPKSLEEREEQIKRQRMMKKVPAMLKELMQDHETLIATARKALDVASEAGDEASADLMTQRLAAHEKFAWMLRSTLGGR